MTIKGDNRILGAQVNLAASDIIEKTNAQRQKTGLPEFKENAQLSQAALDKANDMFQFGYWDHFSPSKRPPWSFILNNGYDYHYAGENLAKDFSTPQQLVDAWMASPPHRANIMNQNYEDIGVAVVSGTLNGKETILVVQMLGKRFNPADYDIAGNELQLLPKEEATPLLENTSLSLGLLRSNKFLATKVLAIAIIFLLIIYIGIDMVKTYHWLKFKNISKKYWGHLLFLLAFGIIVLITRDGNII